MPTPLALIGSIVALTAWTIWIVRSGRAGRWVQLVPVVTCIGAGGLQLLASHTWSAVRTHAAEVNPADKMKFIADGVGRASFFAVGAWVFISIAALLLVILSLRSAIDPDVPSARVVREHHPDQ